MSSEDITYCSNEHCTNTKCERHPMNINLKYVHHSYAMFTECEYWKNSKHCKETLEKELNEAYEEARREGMKLDDNEDTLKWKGTH